MAKNFSDGTNEDFDGYEAIELFLKVADLRDDISGYEEYMKVAQIYRDGLGNVTPDGHKAIKYLLRGVEESKSDLREDDEERVAFDKILDGVHALAFESVAEIYLNGLAGVEPDAAADKFFLMADELTAELD